MEIVIFASEMLRRVLARIGPYAAVEIILPGGTVIALLLYLYRRLAGLKYSAGRMSIRRPVERLQGNATVARHRN